MIWNKAFLSEPFAKAQGGSGRRWFLLVLSWVMVLASSVPIPGQAGQKPPFSEFLKWKPIPAGIQLHYRDGILELQPYASGCVRFRVTHAKQFEPELPYAVIRTSDPSSWKTTEGQQEMLYRSDSLQVRIRKSPLHLTFLDAKGNVLLDQDPLGFRETGTEWTSYHSLMPRERFLGLGEKTGPLDKRGLGYTNWNTDCYGYGPETDPMYVSIPFYMAVHDNGMYGIFLNQSEKSHVNFGASNHRFSSISAEATQLDVFFLSGSSLGSILQEYCKLTGTMPLPPKWSLGYHQSRWSYYPDAEVSEVAEGFRKRNIPLDAIHLDIRYMDQYKIFTWDRRGFPDPEHLVKTLRDRHVTTTVIVDPGIKIDSAYATYREGLSGNHFLRYLDNSLYSGSVWPGECHFPDFTDASCRSWWGGSFRTYVQSGIKGFWNDMNEPATWGQRFPSAVNFSFDGNPRTTLAGRNVYGMQMARATYEGTKSLLGNERPFILSRSGFAGIQRYSALWTGDNSPTDDHLLLGIRLVNSLGLSGVSFAGMDVGGFAGDCTTALFARWISLGAFTPFFRGHKMINLKDAEPWSYGEETEEIARNYIRLRYKLAPYLYAAMYESTQSGMPVSRTLAFELPRDARVYAPAYQHEYCFGPSILVAPVKSTETVAKVFLPPGQWYDLYSDQTYAGDREIYVEAPLHQLPVFVRSSSILPAQKAEASLRIQPDTLEIHCYSGQAPARFLWYDDDGTSFDYAQGKFSRRVFSLNPADKTLELSSQEGSYRPGYRFCKLVFHGFPELTGLTLNDFPVAAARTSHRWLDPYQMVWYATNWACPVQSVSFPLQEGRQIIRWK